MRRASGRTLLVGAGIGVAIAVLGRDTAPARALRRNVGAVGRRARSELGRVQGIVYSVTGRRPDPLVSDDVLADRIRSGLGPLEKRLDIPRVHVMVEDHVALLHGEVPNRADQASVERAVLEIAGVRGIESYLHVGLLPGDTRPSEGRTAAALAPSDAMSRLLEAAARAGVETTDRRIAVRAVLATFAERIPADERSQLLAHLPADVRELAEAPRRSGEAATRARTVDELVTAIVTRSGMSVEHARGIIASVLTELRGLVPEEAADISAVLPEELRRLWTATVPA
jgi:uncharacterized protein (DUF2267 family)